MNKFLIEGGVGGWYIFSKDQVKYNSSFEELINLIKPVLYNSNFKEGIIPTSPGSHFPSFFIASKDLSPKKKS